MVLPQEVPICVVSSGGKDTGFRLMATLRVEIERERCLSDNLIARK